MEFIGKVKVKEVEGFKGLFIYYETKVFEVVVSLVELQTSVGERQRDVFLGERK